jgi:hypothetical protein
MVEADTTRYFHRERLWWAATEMVRDLEMHEFTVEFRVYRMYVRVNGDYSEHFSSWRRRLATGRIIIE